MKSRLMILTLGACALGLSACSKEPADADVEWTVHEGMTEHVDKVADEVWAIGNASIGDAAGLDSKKIDDAGWAKLEEAAARLQNAANKLASLPKYVVNRPGVEISDENIEGGTTSVQVQKNIDADTQGFRDLAHALASHMGDLAAAAKAHDAQKAGPLLDQLDGVCENCHLEFWYPQQRELVEKLLKQAGTPLPAVKK
jgi:hypothetical protein